VVVAEVVKDACDEVVPVRVGASGLDGVDSPPHAARKNDNARTGAATRVRIARSRFGVGPGESTRGGRLLGV